MINDDFYKFYCFCCISWDHYNKKVEDMKSNDDLYFNFLPKNRNKDKLLTEMKEYRRECNKIRFFENVDTSTSFIVCEDKNDLIIAFRGSDSTIDWIKDFSSFRKKYNTNLAEESLNNIIPNGNIFDAYVESCESILDKSITFFRNIKLVNPYRNFNIDKNITKSSLDSKEFTIETRLNRDRIYVHSGFVEQFNSIYDTLDNVIKSYTSTKKIDRIIFCGHSLGSAISKLACVTFMLKYPNLFDKMYHYGYGTPKVGNKHFENLIKDLNKKHKRIFNINIRGDLVSKLPPNIYGYVDVENHFELIPANDEKPPFNTKGNHTVFYYLYLFKYGKRVYKK